MWRTFAVAVVALATGLLMNAYETWLGPWGQMLLGLASAFVISAIVPGFFYRDEPWPWRPWRRDHPDGGSAPNGSPSA